MSERVYFNVDTRDRFGLLYGWRLKGNAGVDFSVRPWCVHDRSVIQEGPALNRVVLPLGAELRIVRDSGEPFVRFDGCVLKCGAAIGGEVPLVLAIPLLAGRKVDVKLPASAVYGKRGFMLSVVCPRGNLVERKCPLLDYLRDIEFGTRALVNVLERRPESVSAVVADSGAADGERGDAVVVDDEEEPCPSFGEEHWLDANPDARALIAHLNDKGGDAERPANDSDEGVEFHMIPSCVASQRLGIVPPSRPPAAFYLALAAGVFGAVALLCFVIRLAMGGAL